MNRLFRDVVLLYCALFAWSLPVVAQFKEVGPPPYSTTVARQKIRMLLDKVDPDNRQQTVDKLSGLLVWYRDILDEELIAGWKRDTRANLTEVMETLADSRVASGVVEYSWREQREAAFNPKYAPMLGRLMSRYPDSAKPFLDDLRQVPTLSPPQAEAVCRILLDAPDIGTWKQSAMQILPRYRPVAERLLADDIRGADREKGYRAQVWLGELNAGAPGGASDPPTQRRRPVLSRSSSLDRTPVSSNGPRVHVDGPSAPIETSASPVTSSAAPRPSLARPPSLYEGASPAHWNPREARSRRTRNTSSTICPLANYSSTTTPNIGKRALRQATRRHRG